MGTYTTLRNHFLIAMPSLLDPNFAQTVTYICEHSSAGAMGIVINLPLSLRLREIFQNMNINSQHEKLNQQPVLAGGPLQPERGFVLHPASNKHWASSLELSNKITVTTSRDILEAMADKQEPPNAIVALGYAAWEGGQLEQEIASNAWLCGPAEPRILFEVPAAERRAAAAALLGINLHCLSTEAGHA